MNQDIARNEITTSSSSVICLKDKADGNKYFWFLHKTLSFESKSQIYCFISRQFPETTGHCRFSQTTQAGIILSGTIFSRCSSRGDVGLIQDEHAFVVMKGHVRQYSSVSH